MQLHRQELQDSLTFSQPCSDDNSQKILDSLTSAVQQIEHTLQKIVKAEQQKQKNSGKILKNIFSFQLKVNLGLINLDVYLLLKGSLKSS